MTEGLSTYDGLAVPLSGESEIKATKAAFDILTLTGASSHTGDYYVGQTSSGVEEVVIRGLSSSNNSAGYQLNVTSTGAIAAGSTLANGFLVSGSSKANMHAAFAYKNDATAVGVTASTVDVGTATSNGFVVAPLFLTAAVATTTPMVGLKVKFGDSIFYVMCIAQCGLSA